MPVIVGAAASSSRVRTSSTSLAEQPQHLVERPERLDRRARSDVRERHHGEFARRVGEHAEPRPVRLQPPQQRARLGVRTEEDGRPVGGEALEQGPPFAERLVEQRRRRDAVGRHRRAAPACAATRPRATPPRGAACRRERRRDRARVWPSPPMLESRHISASGEGTPVRVRDGPAAVRGDALPPRRHWVARPGKAAGEGAPSQKTCRPPPNRTPRGRRIRCSVVPSSASRLSRQPRSRLLGRPPHPRPPPGRMPSRPGSSRSRRRRPRICSRSAPARRSSRSTTTRTTRRRRRTPTSPATRRTSRRSPRYQPDLVVVSDRRRASSQLESSASPSGSSRPPANLDAGVRADPRARPATGHVAAGDEVVPDGGAARSRSSRASRRRAGHLTELLRARPDRTTRRPRRRSSAASTGCSASGTSPTRPTRRQRLPAALGRVHRRRRTRRSSPRRHEVLRPDREDGRRAAGLEDVAAVRAGRVVAVDDDVASRWGPRSSSSRGDRRRSRSQVDGRRRRRCREGSTPRVRARGVDPRWALAAGAFLVGRARSSGSASGRWRSAAARSSSSALSHVPLLPSSSPLDAVQAAVLWQLRAPRVVLAAPRRRRCSRWPARAYQGVFRNPLADPYLLGVAAGAGLGATLAIVYGAGGTGSGRAARRVRRRARRGRRRRTRSGAGRGGAARPAALVLAGVAVASFLTAVQTFVQQHHNDISKASTAGSSAASRPRPGATSARSLPYVAVSRWCCSPAPPPRSTCSALGDEEAAALGVARRAGRGSSIVVAATLGTAAAVGGERADRLRRHHRARTRCGSLAGPSYRAVLPLSILLRARRSSSSPTWSRAPCSPRRSCRSASSPRSSGRRSSSSCCAARGRCA